MTGNIEHAISAIGPGDTSGTETLARYMYQCKVAVQRWLATLALDEEALVLCEFIDDITTVASEAVCFAQVKTRDRGAWTAAKVLTKGGGLDALVRSYVLAKAAGVVAAAQFELLLEGPPSETSETRRFFDDPSSATNAQRSDLEGFGLEAADLDDFLGRLSIVPQYHARGSIDAVTIRLLMDIAPGHSAAIQSLYDSMLERAIAAHTGSEASASPDHPLALQHAPGAAEQELSEEHALTRKALLALLPPVPSVESEQRKLIEAANGGALTMTALEWKLRVAGASAATILRAQERRSALSAALAASPSIGGAGSEDLLLLGERALGHAEAVMTDVVGSAPTPAQAGRPAEVIYARLVQQMPQLGGLDDAEVLDGDGQLVLGLVCELSDQCRFEWRQP